MMILANVLMLMLRRWDARLAMRGFAPASISISIRQITSSLKKTVSEEVICQNRNGTRFRDRSEARLRRAKRASGWGEAPHTRLSKLRQGRRP